MVTINIESVDRSDIIQWESLRVDQNLTSLVDTANFSIRKYGTRTYTPAVGEEVEIYEGANKIFGGTILDFGERVEASVGVVYDINCVDWTYSFDSLLVAKSYENITIEDIIDDIVANFTDGTFTTVNSSSTFLIEKIVFNQVSPSSCLKRLANVVNYDWYIDEDKDIHFFAKSTEVAPFDLQDDSGNYVYKSLARKVDGSQLANKVLVRGGEYDGDLYTDVKTVKGNDTKSFELPYKFSNLTIELDTGSGFVSQTLGIDFIDDFTSVDVLYNYNEKTIKWENPLADGDQIEYSGNPKIPVLAVAEDSASVLQFGVKEKLIRDTSIEDLTTARRRATAELNVYAEELEDANFKTYTSGLRAGMAINVSSVVRGCDTDFLIKKLTFSAYDPNTFKYKATLVTTRRYGLIELLQSVLEPESRQADDREVAEIIKTDTQTVTITELIEVTLAVEDIQTLIITETITKDALGAGIEPTWVLAPYIPTPYPTDPKREGRLDYSLEVY